MKKLLTIIFMAAILALSLNSLQAQDISCWELQNLVEGELSSYGSYYGLDSQFLSSVEAYEHKYIMFVVCTLNYSDYIYCVPKYEFYNWEQYAYGDLVGEAFHTFLSPYECDCW